MHITLVHDWLNQLGGAEDVLDALMHYYPDAPIYTSIYDRARMPEEWLRYDIRASWMDRLPSIYTHHQRYLPLYPLVWDRLDLSAYDVILSNKSGFCHGVQKGKNTLHICYCLAPTRYVWQFDHYATRESLGRMVKLAVKSQLSWLRRWDHRAAQRVDYFIAISTDVQQRIKQFYRRDSIIIYPPVEVKDRFKPADSTGDYFLSLGRLIPYKRVDLIVEACTRLNLPLKVGGKGRDRARLEAIAGPTVEFLGYVPEDQLPELFARCRAFVFPGYEDFGITPVQAQAAGRPVIAYGAGGALDTVIPGKTGILFKEPTVESLMNSLSTFNDSQYDPSFIRQHAMKFDSSVFKAQIMQFVEEKWADFTAKAH